MKKGFFYSTLVALLLSLSACLTQSTKGGSIGVDRKQLLLVSSAQMSQGADKAYSEVIRDAKKNHTLNTNKRMLHRVRSIAKRLIAQVSVFRADAGDWQWKSNLITSESLNAWCMPGGKIVFYTGIIEKLTLNDAEIAAIMGHEIAHALREHGRERASQKMISSIGLDLFSSLIGAKKQTQDLSNLVLQTVVLLPNSRTQEREADRVGVELAARAGYDPRAAANVWRKMANISQQTSIELLSTHPSHKSRITDLEKYSEKVLFLYQKSSS